MSKKTVKYSAKVIDFIVDRMIEERLLPAQVLKKYPDKTPHLRKLYEWQANKPEVREQIDEAYEAVIQLWHCELEELSSPDWCEKHLNEFSDYKMAFEARRARLDALKFTLGKLAGVLSRRWTSKQVVEHKSDGPIQIISYATQQDLSLDLSKPSNEPEDLPLQ